MTLCDNPLWLLSHIRNSFVISDDTGNSQLVLDSGEAYASDQAAVSKTLGYELPAVAKTEGDDDDESLRPRSFEIRQSGRTLYRPRCNTEIKLEKMKRDKKNAPRVKVVAWKSLKSPPSQDELEALFPPKQVQASPPQITPKSALSALLDLHPKPPENPFTKYSRLETHDEKRKEMTIIYSMASPLDPVKRVKICVSPAITVRQVIGHICWKYTRDERQPELKPYVDAYGLFLADHDGAVEYEMPSLEPNEVIAKYGFPILSLVDLEEAKSRRHVSGSSGSPSSPVAAETAKVVLPDGTVTSVAFPGNKTTTVGEVLSDITANNQASLCHTKFSKFKTVNYNLETNDKPGVALDPNLPFYTLKGCPEFYVVREHSRRHSSSASQPKPDDLLSYQIDSIDAAAYQEFHGLQMLTTKLKLRTEVTICVYNERIDVYPKKQVTQTNSVMVNSVVSGGAALLGHKEESFSLDHDVVSSLVVRKQLPGSSNVKYRLRLLMVDHLEEGKYKKVDFECEESLANEIHAKVDYLLSWHSSKARADYLESLNTKKTKR